MYGWRARFGILIPSLDAVTEPEFAALAPEGITCHFHRFSFTGGGLDALVKLKDSVIEKSEAVTHIYPTAVAMCCTAGSFAGGKGWDQTIVEGLRVKSGVPATTATTASLEAMRALGVRRIGMAVPYLEEIARAERNFFEENGMEVVALKWLNRDGFEMYNVSCEATYSLAKEVNDTRAEAIFISCVALPTLYLIEKLENDIQKPVITSNQATMWHLMRLVNIKENITGYGRIFSL